LELPQYNHTTNESYESPGHTMNADNPLLKYIGGGFCGIGLLLTVILLPVSIKKVAHDEFGIRYEGLTKEVHRDEVYEEGKYLCAPETKMYLYPRTIQKMTLDLECLSSNGIEVAVTIDVQYQIPKVNIFSIFDEFGEVGNLEHYLRFVGDDSVRDSVGKFTAKHFYESRADIQSTIEEDMVVSMKRAKAMINVTTVVMSNYDFPEELTAAISDKRSAQNDIEIAESEREGELVEAETDWLTAKISAEQLAIEAEAEVNSILAEANAKATSIVETWANRNSTYSNIKNTLGLNSSEFVEQYLTSVVIESAADPVLSLQAD